jgi:cysteine desulfurase
MMMTAATQLRIYLDYNASAPLLPEARAAMIGMLDAPGNASSVHREGNVQKRAVTDARRAVAALVAGKPGNVVFTSGATEAAAMLLTPDWTLGRALLPFGRLIVGATEHPCIASGGRFPIGQVTIAPVDGNGLIDLVALQTELQALGAGQIRPLVAIQAANNETGVIQNVSTIAQVVHSAAGFLVVDASQAAGRISLDINTLGADAMILSAHKLGGPKGAGAIIFGGEVTRPKPMLNGGGQEQGFRAGTENAPAIAGFGAAALASVQGLPNRGPVRCLRDRLEQEILSGIPGTVIHGAICDRLDNTTFFSLPGRKAETVMIALDLAGIAVSSGSACSSGKVGRSAVLEAMGWSGEGGAVRVSLGPGSTDHDIDRLVAALRATVSRADR